jgi:hypothetical protein
MKKNAASQVVGAQLVSKTDGSAVTSGTTTVYVTGDGGTQAAGSVGSGACTHEGNGFWTYAPAQAETNYDHVAFTFVNTSAVNTTVQIYPSFPQTGDNYSRIGPAIGSPTQTLTEDIANLWADTNDIQSRLPAALVGGRIDSSVGAMAANVLTATAIAADAITDAKVASDVTIASVTGAVGSVTGAVGSVTGNVGGNVTGSVGSIATGGIAAASFAADAINAAAIAADAVTEIQSGLSTLNAAGVRSAVGLASANLDAQLDALPTAAENADAVWDEAIAGHAGAGSTGEALSAAGAAGDPWITALPGSYTAGQAGYIVGTNVNATVSSRATQTSADSIKSVTDILNGMIETGAGSPTYYRYTDGALEQAPTGGSAPTASAIADEVQTRTIAAVTTVNGLAANTVTAAALAADAVTEIQSGLSTLTAAGVRTAVGLASANLDTQLDALPTASENATAVNTMTLTESYAADGATMTPAQAFYMIWSLLAERGISGTTLTAKKLDGSTTSMTFTLDSATTPTEQTRAT